MIVVVSVPDGPGTMPLEWYSTTTSRTGRISGLAQTRVGPPINNPARISNLCRTRGLLAKWQSEPESVDAVILLHYQHVMVRQRNRTRTSRWMLCVSLELRLQPPRSAARSLPSPADCRRPAPATAASG